MVERESQQISRRGETGRAFVIGARAERFETETSRPRKISSGRMKNRRTESSNFSLSPPFLAKSSLSPLRGSFVHTAVNENRITAYQFTILFAHRWRGHALSRVVSRVHAKKAVCVLDTYRQSEIYVAQGESGALKYYRFASRLHIHAWPGRRGWKN